ncbi:MAG: T9SS type A sorting domain-containing protein [Bacteroidetes bacterium]|nr:T9SS type A sorting domain-containing protein [Bacteroidota bacterium]
MHLNSLYLKGFAVSLLVILLINPIYAQQDEHCGTVEYMEMLKSKDPLLEGHMLKIEKDLQALIKSGKLDNDRVIITIPVVVHVVYKVAAQNISDAQILSQIDVLNEDFRRLNSDASSTPSTFQTVAADAEIEFCMASVDPAGCATSGITRTQTNFSTFGKENNVKAFHTGGADPWPTSDYLNIWVCNLTSGLLGYAQFPGGPSEFDGIAVDYRAFGTTGNLSPTSDRGRTTTHEVGHWLNLIHIWGDDNGACTGDDFVSDTPNQGDNYFGCPSFPKTSCSTSDMFMNFMDYVNDKCSNLFTVGQATRMKATLNGTRTSIISSAGCSNQSLKTLDAGIAQVKVPGGTVYCESQVSPVVTIRNFGSNTLTSVTINYQIDNGTTNQYSWTGSLSSCKSEDVTLKGIIVSNGTHTFNSYTSAPNGNTDLATFNDADTSTFTVVTSQNVLFPVNQNFESASFPPADWNIFNPNNNVVWSKYFIGAFGNSTGCTRINIFDINDNSTLQSDFFISPVFNLGNGSSPTNLTFTVAYARQSNQLFDSLFINISTDCGASWKRIWAKGGITLRTAADHTIEFIPTDSEWRDESVSLNNYIGNAKVQISFEAFSGWGNNIYLDDINIDYPGSSIYEFEPEFLASIQPNPTDGIIKLSLSSDVIKSYEIVIYDILGREIFNGRTDKVQFLELDIDLSDANSGLHFIKINDGKVIRTMKIVLKQK